MKTKLAFLIKGIGDEKAIEKFVSGSHIDHGHHPDAAHRMDLMLAVLAFAAHDKDKPAVWQRLSEWWLSRPVLLGERDPIDYLVNSDDVSDSLWLGVAFNAILSTGRYVWITDERAEDMFRQFQPMFETMVDEESEE